MPNYTYPEVDPAIAAVKNKLGARTHDDLERLEAEKVAARRIEIGLGYGPSGQFDSAHLRAIHRHLFQDVYEWAGHTRDEGVTLSDGTVASEPTLRKLAGLNFAVGRAIAADLDRITGSLRDRNYLRGLTRKAFSESAADVMAELNSVHPFREGNGRTQRAYVSELAREAGYELDFSVVSRERMLQASIAAHKSGDKAMMRRMFNEITDPVRIAALDQAIRSLDGQNFRWNDHYLATVEDGHQVEVTMAGMAGTHFMARTRTEILIGKVSDLPTPLPFRQEAFTLRPTSWGRVRDGRTEAATGGLQPASPTRSGDGDKYTDWTGSGSLAGNTPKGAKDQYTDWTAQRQKPAKSGTDPAEPSPSNVPDKTNKNRRKT